MAIEVVGNIRLLQCEDGYEIRDAGQGDKLVGVIVHNGDGWRACHMPGLRAFSPVGIDDLGRVKAYAVREFQTERQAA